MRWMTLATRLRPVRPRTARPRTARPRTVPLVVAWLLVAAVLVPGAPARGDLPVDTPWPEPEAGPAGEAVTFDSHSPFVLAHVGTGPDDDPPHVAQGTLFLPPGASAEAPVPAVVMLHGAGGVLEPRELTYGRQLAQMGVAALAIDVFASRRDFATGFTRRLIYVTESMILADAYSALDWLAEMPQIDADRIALMGFSYGGMTSVFASYEQVATLYAGAEGRRFQGHVGFYGPCIARFEDPTTTGAPVLMLWGSGDDIVDPDRCAEIADDLRAGGSVVRQVIYPDALHQWDGGSVGAWSAGRNLADCRLRVSETNTIRDRRTLIPMTGPRTRMAILGLCVDDAGYLIGRDDAVRARSNREVARFLNPLLFPTAKVQGPDDAETQTDRSEG